MWVRALARTLGKMTAPDALPPSRLPSTVEVCRVLCELSRRHFSRETHARLLDADVTGGVLTVVAWQAGPSPEDRGQVIAQRTGLGMRLAECEGDLEAVLWMCCSARCSSRARRAGRPLGLSRHGCWSGTPRPPGTRRGRAARRGGRSACSRVQAHERSPCRHGWWRCFVLPEMSDRGRSARISGAPPSSAPV